LGGDLSNTELGGRRRLSKWWGGGGAGQWGVFRLSGLDVTIRDLRGKGKKKKGGHNKKTKGC